MKLGRCEVNRTQQVRDDDGVRSTSGCDNAQEGPLASSGCKDTASVNRLVPFVHVADVEASLKFYSLLGFTPANAMKDNNGKMFWVMAQSQAAEIMLAKRPA